MAALFFFVRRFLVKAIARTRTTLSYKLRICVFFKILKFFEFCVLFVFPAVRSLHFVWFAKFAAMTLLFESLAHSILNICRDSGGYVTPKVIVVNKSDRCH